ncbi:hypothetical protein TorRG33x02_305860 [Trema orientale]|uniref:Uncharacterized protein n=1 Tax=Trema orientale TaxID=63057 RepID=A0A2P5BWX6_TREOI|nr:hypothetical protein TorRG33x02_305860 [Trema orientale]
MVELRVPMPYRDPWKCENQRHPTLIHGWQPCIQEGAAEWDEEWDKLPNSYPVRKSSTARPGIVFVVR